MSASPITSEFLAGGWVILYFFKGSNREAGKHPWIGWNCDQALQVSHRGSPRLRGGPTKDRRPRSGRNAASHSGPLRVCLLFRWGASPGCMGFMTLGYYLVSCPWTTAGSKNEGAVSPHLARQWPWHQRTSMYIKYSLNAILGSLVRIRLSTSNCPGQNNPEKKG